MTPDRADSYIQLTRLLEELGPTKLHDDEQERVREAADTLVFAATYDTEVAQAVDDVDLLAGGLVDSGRWEIEGADRLTRLLSACGPEKAEALAGQA